MLLVNSDNKQTNKYLIWMITYSINNDLNSLTNYYLKLIN